MRKQRFITSLAVGLVLTLFLGLPPRAAALSFSDVPPEHWARAEITAMADRGLIQGSGGTFRPGDSVSNQAFLSMLCRASGFDDRSLEAGSRWADPALAYGAYFGWFDETELNTENQAAPITREFAAKLLVNALFPEENTSGSLSFRDAYKIAPACVPQVRTAVKLGLLGGYEDGCFHPKDPLTRAAAAALLDRALSLKETVPADGGPVQVPILMYHDVSYLGRGYSKTPEQFRAQMQELKDAGFHTIFYSQLIDYVENGTPLPEKPIVISIDDGYQTNYTYVLPILRELDMKAEISLIGDAILYAGWGLSWEQVREMRDSGLVSFQSHTKSLHRDHTASGGRLGVLKLDSESWADYVRVLGDDTQAILDLLEQETGVRPQAFTYPRGQWSTMADGVMARFGCKVSVTTKDGVARVTQGDLSSLRLMGRIGMDFRNGSVLDILNRFGYPA